MLRFARMLLLPLLLLGLALFALSRYSQPAQTPPVLAALADNGPLVVAHRGGKGLWPESSLFAFERASALGVDMIEMDVHLSRDGQLVVIHDATVDRTTDGRGAVAELTLAQLQRLDAGYRWTADGGQSFPYRGEGVRIPLLSEIFERLPEQPKVIEMKGAEAGIEEQLCNLLHSSKQTERVIVGSFHERTLRRFRKLCPSVATSADPLSVRILVGLNWLGLGQLLSPSYQTLQIPEQHGMLTVANASLLQRAHERGLHVQLWTINEQPTMRRLLELGADGLITDYPDRALQLLGRPTRLAHSHFD
ncbi:glycerophosphodiester phosphodiesterase [Pseudomonas sp. PDM14]|uniref:glycerophosphodiester phosphodiesterase n=1 Tax=Pseudomonas sp. PDM14 TaxID=2769288 RepID=UPI00177F3E03|nr:glycerophosphodiester phosphodiesterase [Pseudomonas sp. PDM14]MBD9482630.1 glycerophosphodiester phosphodiesterase [Pseudomonas sp. PDM14]